MRWQLTSESIRKEVRNVPDSVDCCPAKSCSTKLYCEANRAQIQIGHIQIVHSINSVTFLFCLTAVEFKASRREIAHFWKRILLSQFEDNRSVLEIST